MAETTEIPWRDLKRPAKVAVFRKYHEQVLKALGGADAFFACKSITMGDFKDYKLPAGKVGFFESELKGDCYFEMTTYDIASTDQNRQLYLLPYDPHFKQDNLKYELVELTPAKNPQYYVEIKSFKKVYMPVAVNTEDDEFDFPVVKQGDDMSQDKLTARDRVCIDLKVPESNHEWINELIRKSMIPITKKSKI